MSAFGNYVAVAPLYLLNKLPLRVLYALSTLFYFLIYYIIRYRRGVVRKNLCSSFPEKSKKELRVIERDFYRRFCDYFMEAIKFYGMSAEEVRKHIEFTGLDELSQMLDKGHSCVCYMLHTFNWEFIVSLPLFIQKENVVAGAIYHKLRNPFFDNIFKKMRAQYGADNVTMKNTLRRVIEVTKNGQKFIYGFMADQLPKIEAMNHWVTFLNQETAVFTGAEKIARRVKASAFYVTMTRVKRGKYVAHFDLMVEDATTLPENELTNEYFRLGEKDIRREPASWLWTHNRWKRTRVHKEAFDRHIAARKQQMTAAENS